MLLKIFDAEFHYKPSNFEPLCLPAKMAAKTVKRPIYESFLQHSKVEKKIMLDNLCNTHQLSTGKNICSSVGEGGGGILARTKLGCGVAVIAGNIILQCQHVQGPTINCKHRRS